MKRRIRSAFTLVELLVVIAMISIIVALIFPAVQAARESSRRVSCNSKVTKLILAVHAYEDAFAFYPPGTMNPQGPITDQPEGQHHNWISHVLPFMEEKSAYKAIDFETSVYDQANAEIRSHYLSGLVCPSDAGNRNANWAFSSFAGVHHDSASAIDIDNNGVFFLNSEIAYEDVSDGAAQTLFLGEKIIQPKTDLGWMSGTNATLRNAGSPINRTGKFIRIAVQDEAAPDSSDVDSGDEGADIEDEGLDEGYRELGSDEFSEFGERPEPEFKRIMPKAPQGVGGFSSHHARGAHFATGAGQVRFLSETIDPEVYRKLCNRSDGELVDQRELE